MTDFKKILVLGATSAIAQSVARLFAGEGASFFLVARDSRKLEAVGNDLQIRGAKAVHCFPSDLASFAGHGALMEKAFESLHEVDLVFIAHGVLGDPLELEQDFLAAQSLFEVNFLSVVSLITLLVPRLRKQKKGTIAVLSSVAGDRGRGSNFVYGTSKAALNTYLQGWRNRLFPEGIRVVTIKPGPVTTPMTQGKEKGLLWVSAPQAGRSIHRLLRRGRDEFYVPGFWRLIMFVIGCIPETVFKRLKL